MEVVQKLIRSKHKLQLFLTKEDAATVAQRQVNFKNMSQKYGFIWSVSRLKYDWTSVKGREIVSTFTESGFAVRFGLWDL